MTFTWGKFTKEQYEELQTKAINNELIDGGFYGCIYVGSVCFEIITREYPTYNNGNWEYGISIDYDVYALGIGNYSKTDNGIPYDDCGGGSFGWFIEDMEYGEFKSKAEGIFKTFLDNYNLLDYANKETVIW